MRECLQRNGIVVMNQAGELREDNYNDGNCANIAPLHIIGYYMANQTECQDDWSDYLCLGPQAIFEATVAVVQPGSNNLGNQGLPPA